MTSMPIRDRREGDTEEKREGRVKTEAEIRVMLSQAKKHLEPPEARRRSKKGFFPSAFGGSVAC